MLIGLKRLNESQSLLNEESNAFACRTGGSKEIMKTTRYWHCHHYPRKTETKGVAKVNDHVIRNITLGSRYRITLVLKHFWEQPRSVFVRTRRMDKKRTPGDRTFSDLWGREPYLIIEAQWLSGSVSRFHATGPGFKFRAGQGRLSLSSLQRVDKISTKLAWN
ncbi:hypothetical protein TNCV_1853651 [Trichonephila clavipes]|nr:hypothetical protein TNCV_1853651 [Trichonephila clavipes]